MFKEFFKGISDKLHITRVKYGNEFEFNRGYSPMQIFIVGVLMASFASEIGFYLILFSVGIMIGELTVGIIRVLFRLWKGKR